jgi:cell division protein FtsI (penicillin-binding protein 3)
VVAMEPDTGRILALASYPTYDPNRFREFNQVSFRNRCLVGAFEPGSTFKVFVAAAALEEGVLRPNERFFGENGVYTVGGATIRDSKPHGWLSVEEVIAESSNICAAKIGQRLGWERIVHAARAFGFGTRTGVDFPGESAGSLPSGAGWSDLATATFSFGQGLSVTPLQMVAAVSVIANGGRLMKPYLVESVIDPDGTERLVAGPSRVRQVIGPETAAIVTGFMERVVSEHGTGLKAAVSGYAVAGKTGTAQKPKENARGYAEGKYFSSFLGFLPADRPRLAMIVVLDEPNSEFAYGGWVAAPIFAAIAKQAMVLLKVPGRDGPAIASTEPAPGLPSVENDAQARIQKWQEARAWNAGRRAATAGGVLPDLRGLTLRQALRVAGGMQLQVEVAGSGMVTDQNPEAGSPVRGGQMVRLKLEETL